MNVLAINWANVGLQAGQLLLALSILVILHEFGHYITARWFKCRVEKFFLFFDPWFALVKKKIGDTVYGIGWLPLGGYVKISGMIDESMDKEAMKEPPKEWEFRSKPAWQRLIVMLGGIIMNVLVAFVIYAFILMIWGDKKIPTSSMKYGIHVVDSTMYNKVGLRNGDIILNIDGEEIKDFERLRRKGLLGSSMEVMRDGKHMTLDVPQSLIGELVENKKKNAGGFIEPRKPAIVFYIDDTAKAYKAGLRKNDRIVGLDSTRFDFFDELQNQLNQHKSKAVSLNVIRNGQELNFPVEISEEGRLGFVPYGIDYLQMDSLGWLKLDVTKYGFLAAFPAGVKKTGTELKFYIDQFKKILNPNTGAYKGVGGFKAMGSIFPKYGWDWEAFWRITAFLSIVLAFMNLLPIPALDGGHVMFTLYEMITRRKPNEKFLEYAQIVGMVLLLGLMLYANGNDWFGWGK
ncbi:MAG TPA: RIP metalloprotease RseP [Chitinophagaceae bacterium]|nr:RIP metalloprotease RseP [Chitinophagaceae bacterium]